MEEHKIKTALEQQRLQSRKLLVEHKLLDVEAEDWVGSGIEEEIVAF